MTHFGIEIEIKGLGFPSQTAETLSGNGFDIRAEHYNHSVRNHWKVVPDGSVSNGSEIVSPILTFDALGLREVGLVVDTIKAKQGYADYDCGIHIHVDARFLQDYSRDKRERFFQFLYAAYQANEDSFDLLVLDRRNNNNYCRSTKGMSYAVGSSYRHCKLNIKTAYESHGTIEFRHFQSSTNSKTVQAWVTLVVSFFQNVKARFESLAGGNGQASNSATL